MCTVLLDISTLLIGEKQTRTFITNPPTNDELVMEFELLKSDEINDAYHSNGIVVTAPITALNVGIEELLNNFSVKNKLLWIVGSYQGTQPLTSTESTNLCFYINRDLETEMALISKDDPEAASSAQMVQLDPLPANHSGKVSLEMGQDVVDLDMETNEHQNKEPDVRMQFDIPPEEKEFLKQRKVVVAEALQKLLGFRSGLKPEQVPTIAVVASGGGARAMTGLLGGLKALKEMGVLDTVTYITGVSGSTWTMSALYQDPNWSTKDMDTFIRAEKEQMTKSTQSAFTPDKMQYYHEEMKAKEDDGHPVSFSDMAGLVFEHLIFGKKMTGTLSEQRRTVSEGQNPLPIYTAVNMKDKDQPESEAEWCEFTPYEVGLLRYGAFVPSEHFGSHFFLGHLVEKLPELRLPYLIGIWSSALAVNVTEVWKSVTGAVPPWSVHGEHVPHTESCDQPSSLDTAALVPASDITSVLTHFFSARVGAAETFNYMRGFFLHWNYDKHPNFAAWKEKNPELFPHQLTPSDSMLQLVDAAHSIDIGCAPVLRPERNVDVIIILSYSWEPEHIHRVIQLTADYCQDHRIPFPQVDWSRLDQDPQEVYVFEDEQDPDAPVVIHFPLVNISYRHYKSPGVKRQTEEEIQAADVDVRSWTCADERLKLTSSEQDYQALVDLAYYNVLNNKETVHSSIWKEVQKKKNQPEPQTGWCTLH
ncbi:cytosolic phospholipase A2 zeta-like isoform X2 [Sphaeramia orbicularis]|nr:cytosolic phospholipase A2 zeta-like isoform X2 [Sphaeramia orbicularis]XP_029986114.1 cytosolic phospholipase A2 zeta-like isoform X2 [Sphaeramia orbicularis]